MAESILLGTEAQGTRLLQSSVGSVGMGGCACVFISSSSFYCEDVTGQVVSYSRKDFSTVFLVNSSEPLTAYLLASSFQLPASFPRFLFPTIIIPQQQEPFMPSHSCSRSNILPGRASLPFLPPLSPCLPRTWGRSPGY